MPELEIDPSATRTSGATAARNRRLQYNRVMKVVRRAHLYAGLFMTPWVFLYGITAFLFNHPEAFPDARLIHFGTAEWAGTSLEQRPRPEELASRVVAALNASAKPEAGGYRLAAKSEARFGREFFATVRADGQEQIVRIDLETGEGTVRSQPKPATEVPPFVAKAGVKLSPAPMEPVTRALPALLDRLKVSGDRVVERTTAPDLSFLMEGQGKTWRVTYNAQTGRVSGRTESEPGALSTRGFLLRLHLAHHYPSAIDARWFWALGVDAMFLSMVGWGSTGLLMWWQMKNVRKVGVVVLIFSVLTAIAVAIGMHRILAG